MPGAGTALGQNLSVWSGSNLMDALITDLLSKVRVGSPKPSRGHSRAVNGWCQERNSLGGSQPTRQCTREWMGLGYYICLRGQQQSAQQNSQPKRRNKGPKRTRLL